MLQNQLRGCNFGKQRSYNSFTKPAAIRIRLGDDSDTQIDDDTQPDSDAEPEEASLVLPEGDTDSDREITEPSDSVDREKILCGSTASSAQQGGIATPPPLPAIDIAADADGAHVKVQGIDEESAEYKLAFERGLQYAAKENKLHHYFPPKHLFEELFDIPAGKKDVEIEIQTAFVKRVIKEILKLPDLPLKDCDLKDFIIILDGIPIEVVVIMHEGTIKMGDMYVAAKLLPKEILNSLPQAVIDSLPESVKKLLKR